MSTWELQSYVLICDMADKYSALLFLMDNAGGMLTLFLVSSLPFSRSLGTGGLSLEGATVFCCKSLCFVMPVMLRREGFVVNMMGGLGSRQSCSSVA